MTSEHSCGYCDIGSYEGMIELVAPSWSSKKTICVDICIALEITSLWQAGIRTTGCCCGHGKAHGYIGVWDEDIPAMSELGYVVRPNETDPSRKDGFYPKTKLLLTSERATPSADPLAGLVRYEFDRESGSSFFAADKSERAPNGEYVLHSQAAEIIAADRAEKHKAQNAVLNLERKLAQHEAQHEKEMTEVIKERDQCEAWADKLAYAIGGEAIGEHSNMNSPWANALEIAASPAPAADLKAENKRLREAIENTDCPRPCNGRPDDTTVKQCISYGECACVYGSALKGESNV